MANSWAGITVTAGGTLNAGVPFVTPTGAVGGGVYSTGFGGPDNNGAGYYVATSSDTVDGQLVGGTVPLTPVDIAIGT